MEKNDILTGQVIALGSNGEGVLRENGIVVFLPFALPTEKVQYKVLKVQKNIAYGKVLDFLTPAEERIRPKCKFFGKCGGCQLQHLKYSEQLKFKEEKVKECFKKIANIDTKISPCEKGDNDFEYRNKLQLPVANVDGKTIIGFYAENSHRVVEINDCCINPYWTKQIISSFKQYFERFNVIGYDEQKNCGDIREITVKDVKGKLIICVVSLNEQLKNTSELIEILKNNLNNEFSLFININKNNNNVIYGDTFKLLYGENTITNETHGIKYKIGVQSFMQVNDVVCGKLYSAVKNNIDADKDTTVIDAYSGAGLMTAMLSIDAKKAIGIEIIKEAVENANQLATINGLDNKIKNYQGKCEEILPDIIEKERKISSKISVVLDPPRKGVDIAVINAILKCEIDKIVYVSCNPATLARDVGLITGSLEVVGNEVKRTENFLPRYNVVKVKPFDMFPQTKHIETLCVLERVKK